jgi:hypothetical protein
MASGQALTALCKTHLLETMRGLPECAPDGPGLGNKAIEDAAELDLRLPARNSYFTWSLLFSLILERKVETVQSGRSRPKYRLTG